MGSDRLRFETPQIKAISIHAPRMGSDAVSWPSSWRGTRFQSTLPGWGATHAPRRRQPQLLISIHAPRMGSDPAFIIFLPKFKIFQSTLPGWGATGAGCRGEMAVRISIHAPRMGSDAVFAMPQVWWRISIHAPRMGSDHPARTGFEVIVYFNPRSPDGERLSGSRSRSVATGISIHAPRMGSDHK